MDISAKEFFDSIASISGFLFLLQLVTPGTVETKIEFIQSLF